MKKNPYLSAADPCLSPLTSFLKAYDTDIGRLHRYWLFIASIAASDASNDAKLINANALEFPVSGSRMTYKYGKANVIINQYRKLKDTKKHKNKRFLFQ